MTPDQTDRARAVQRENNDRTRDRADTAPHHYCPVCLWHRLVCTCP